MNQILICNDNSSDNPSLLGMKGSYVYFISNNLKEEFNPIPEAEEQGCVELILSMDKVIEVLKNNNLLKECRVDGRLRARDIPEKTHRKTAKERKRLLSSKTSKLKYGT
jgi:hypothetical protein